MTDLTTFTNSEFGDIRTYEEDGKILFCGADVAKALGYSNVRDAIAKHCRCVAKRDIPHPQSPSKTIEMTFITEGDIYRLTAQSKLEKAQRFERWVFDEVLPTIRKTGGYGQPRFNREQLTSLEFVHDLLANTENLLVENNELKAQNSALTVEVAIMRPKADCFDDIVNRNLLTGIRETAKVLKIPPKKFCDYLKDHKYLYNDKSGKLMPYENKNDGLFEVKECFNEKTGWRGTQTMVTPKGCETFRLLCEDLRG